MPISRREIDRVSVQLPLKLKMTKSPVLSSKIVYTEHPLQQIEPVQQVTQQEVQVPSHSLAQPTAGSTNILRTNNVPGEGFHHCRMQTQDIW